MTDVIDTNLLNYMQRNTIENYQPNLFGISKLRGSAFAYSTTMITLDLGDITQIDSYCFRNCSNLTNINFRKIKTIGYGAFVYCSSLTSIELPSSVTSIGNSAFTGCTNLETITINKPQNSISGAPWGAPNATVIWNG